MENLDLEDFLQKLAAAGWEITLHEPPMSDLPETLTKRYPNAPEGYRQFLKRVSRCINPGQTAWFICREDFDGTLNSPYAWNEWELMCKSSSDDDIQLETESRAFWDAHLPIINSVSPCYS